MSGNLFESAAKLIASADGLLITAGAGMGVDSGLPDFRGNEGFWKAYPALAHSGSPSLLSLIPTHFVSIPGRHGGSTVTDLRFTAKLFLMKASGY